MIRPPPFMRTEPCTKLGERVPIFFRYVNRAFDALLQPFMQALHRCRQPDCLAVALADRCHQDRRNAWSLLFHLPPYAQSFDGIDEMTFRPAISTMRIKEAGDLLGAASSLGALFG